MSPVSEANRKLVVEAFAKMVRRTYFVIMAFSFLERLVQIFVIMI
jgi:hypothetical protein